MKVKCPINDSYLAEICAKASKDTARPLMTGGFEVLWSIILIKRNEYYPQVHGQNVLVQSN
jgi:hypothetical protein